MGRACLVALVCLVLSTICSASGYDTKEDGMVGGIPKQWDACVVPFRPGAYSVTDLKAMAKQPNTVFELLQNLKLVWERDLLLQPAFFDESALEAFFGASRLTWGTTFSPDPGNGVNAVAVINSTAFPGLTISVESRCSQSEQKFRDGWVGVRVDLIGFLRINEMPMKTVTLRALREAFGPENGNEIDLGYSLDGPTYAPAYKGSVTYQDSSPSSEDIKLGTTFYFRRDSSGAGVGPTKNILDDDIVQRVDMHQAQHRFERK